MKIKHTPGPWILSDTTKAGNRKVSGYGWDYFANVTVRMDGTAANCEEGEANARLIAAAPDLLAALKAIVEFHQGSKVGKAVQETARAAIAKSEGI